MNKKEWMNLNDGENDIWKFYYEDVENTFENGVHIKIKELSSSLREYLSRPINIDKLQRKIGSAYRELLSKNITILINGEPVVYVSEPLYESDFLKTYVKTISNVPGVKIKIIAGLGNPQPKDAGWSIVSNGRVIIEKNRNELTGWETEYDSEDEDNIDEVLERREIPAYHNDFARFRGYVFLNSDDPNLLPLNTTKDGIDEQHKVYRFVLKEMVDALRIILPKIREYVKVSRTYRNEQKEAPEDAFICKNISDFYAVETSKFKLEMSEYQAFDMMKNIPLYIPAKKVEFLKSFFDADTNRQLGEKVLNFVLERIDLEDE
jgi:hypothetical protein